MTEAPEVWLFGSAARGDTDARSDVDLLVAGRVDEVVLEDLGFPAAAVSIVHYSWPELEHMATYGSLFLQHVHVEGRLVLGDDPSRLRTLMTAMPRYARAHSELASFQQVLDDVERSIANDHVPAFELSVIATALRHACILGCYAIGYPAFGRNSAFAVFLEHARRVEDVAAAQQLYEFRLHEDGRAPVPFAASTNDVERWLTNAREILADVEGSLYGDSRAVS